MKQLVQSLNSPFFPSHIGAEPGRAKEESRIPCMRMLRTPPFFSPESGEKPYLEVFSRFGLGRDFLNDNIQATISAFRLIKNMSINPKSVEFHQCHAKPHSICFFYHDIKENERNLCQDLLTIHRTKKDGGCTFYHNTLRTKLSSQGMYKRYGLTAVVPILTALLLSSLNDLQFFFVFLYAFLAFSGAKHYR